MPSTSSRGNAYMLGSEDANLIDDYTRLLQEKLDLSTPYRMAAGTVTVSTDSIANTAVLPFPASRFTQPPVVTATARSGVGTYNVTTNNVTTSSGVIAVPMTPTDAEG